MNQRTESVQAYLYDADGHDRRVALNQSVVKQLNERQLLWIDVDGQQEQQLAQLAQLLGLTDESVAKILSPTFRPALGQYPNYFQIDLIGIRQNGQRYETVEVSLISGANVVLTIHAGPVEFLDNFDEHIRGDSQIGQLSAASFMATLLDWHLSSYFRAIEELEDQVDRFDEKVMSHEQTGAELLDDLYALRRRVTQLRRLIQPHREVFAALLRPEFKIFASDETEMHVQAVYERFEGALAAVENGRQLVLGAFELFMTQTTQQTNEIMKVLTLATVMLGLVASVAGIFGMNFELGLFTVGALAFWGVIGIMAIGLLAILLLARRWGWL